jgi:BirA family biotin operon repressor/biotin-[acetyl-CoA-carboxylase] ligase
LRLGSPRLHLRRTDSTNERARRLARAGAAHGTLVTAAEQTAGRGRQGRAWTAPPGRALLMSIVLRDWPVLLPLAAGVAVTDAIDRGARVKWPNDVLLEGRKVAGILVEARPQEGWAVLGIGLNVALHSDDFPPELREGAATLGLEASAIEPLLASLLAALERRLVESSDDVLEALRARDGLRDRQISWAGGSGRGGGIDAQGRLVVVQPSGERVALEAGEVHLGTLPHSSTE